MSYHTEEIVYALLKPIKYADLIPSLLQGYKEYT